MHFVRRRSSGLFVGIRCARFACDRCLLTPDPTGKPDGSKCDRSALGPSSRARRLRRRVDQFAIDLGGFPRRCRPLPRHALRARNPSADIRERFGAADRTALLIVNLLAVQAETRDAKVHRLMINPRRDNSPSVRGNARVALRSRGPRVSRVLSSDQTQTKIPE